MSTKPDTIKFPAEATHYCRICRSAFRSEQGQASPHMRAVLHTRRLHPRGTYTLSCSKACEQHEQPDEAREGRRLYGPGVRKPKTLATYDALFPKSSCD